MAIAVRKIEKGLDAKTSRRIPNFKKCLPIGPSKVLKSGS